MCCFFAGILVVTGDPVGHALTESMVIIGLLQIIESSRRDFLLPVPHLFVTHFPPLHKAELPRREAGASPDPPAKEKITIAEKVSDGVCSYCDNTLNRDC